MNYFLIGLISLSFLPYCCTPQPKNMRNAQPFTMHSQDQIEIEDLISLCIQIAETTNSPESCLLQKIIIKSRSKTMIPMRSLIRMVKYAGITLKICEARHDLPVHRIQQLSELLSTYWAAVWERWNTKNVYPVNLELLARFVETTHATTTDSSPRP